MNGEDGELRRRMEVLCGLVEALSTIDRLTCQYFKDRIPKWYELRPDFLVLTARSATVFQPLIKRAWARTYDSETVPEMFNVDPHLLQYGFRPGRPIFPEGKFKGGSKVLIFDEISGGYNDIGKPRKYTPVVTDKTGIINSLDAVGNYIHSLGVEDIWIDTGESALWGAGDKALLQRATSEHGDILERRRGKEEVKRALENAKRMRALGELVADSIKNNVEIK